MRAVAVAVVAAHVQVESVLSHKNMPLLLFHAPPPGFTLGSAAPLPHWSGSAATEFPAQRRNRALPPHAASDETGHQAARRPKPPDSRTAQERLALKRDRSGGFNLAVRARRTTWCSGAEEMGAPKRQEPQTESGAKRPEPLPPNPDHHPPDHQPAPRPAPHARRRRRARRMRTAHRAAVRIWRRRVGKGRGSDKAARFNSNLLSV